MQFLFVMRHAGVGSLAPMLRLLVDRGHEVRLAVGKTKHEESARAIREVIEHVAIVNEGMSKICAKLLSKAEAAGGAGDGSLHVSPEFIAKLESIREEKMKAPEMVLPVNSLSVSASIERLDSGAALFADLRQKFETVDGTEPKFPHPLFSGLSAQEWLVLAGAHEHRPMHAPELVGWKRTSSWPSASACFSCVSSRIFDMPAAARRASTSSASPLAGAGSWSPRRRASAVR